MNLNGLHIYLQRAFEESLLARVDILGLIELKAHDSHCAKRLHTFHSPI
jgi:hypothetical protein